MGAIDGRGTDAEVASHPESDESEASPLRDVSESVRTGNMEGTASATGDMSAMVADVVVTGAATVMLAFLSKRR